jgi:two-component system, NarL family, sensor histidine kinase UhpB
MPPEGSPPAPPWSDQRFLALTKHSSDIISLLDAEGRLVFNSPAAERISGFSPAELAGVNTFELIHPEDQPQVAEAFRTVLAAPGATATVQYRYRTKAGGWTWMEAVATNLLDDPEVGGVVANSRDITDRKRAEAALRESEERLRALTVRMQDALEEEQSRLARDLHDDLAQLLTGLKLDLSRLERRLVEAGAQGWIEDCLVAATDQVDQAHASVRRIAAGLRSPSLDALGLAEALASEARRFEARFGVRCEVRVAPLLTLPPESATAIYRITQESLTNVARHAGATRVQVALAIEGDEVVLRIEDDGRGPATWPVGSAGLGLLGMSERAARLGGTARLERATGGGAAVVTRLPLESGLARPPG